ncbi:hypothetical protein TDB9533_03191 [Thalassocella blandensis]|nr:hypothetical protein TDB9533_03191 [Thalassocella blandensis]
MSHHISAPFFPMTRHRRINILRSIIGLEKNTTSHVEKLISGAGALLGIACIYCVTAYLAQQGVLSSPTSTLIVASMGASAVLLFAVPHGALSQPWALVGGHLGSALIGVCCAILIPNLLLSAAFAVGLAICFMHYFRCIHPPGGATALSAVIGGSTVHELGFYFILAPVLINVVTILAVAILFNSLFSWRRYPAYFSKKHYTDKITQTADRQIELTQEDFAAAMLEVDSYIDITSEGLIELLELAKFHAEKNTTHPHTIQPGHYYSNGKLGNLWSVRHVVDASQPEEKAQVIYKVVAGQSAYETGICSLEEFVQWARFEVVQHNQQWIKPIQND